MHDERNIKFQINFIVLQTIKLLIVLFELSFTKLKYTKLIIWHKFVKGKFPSLKLS